MKNAVRKIALSTLFALSATAAVAEGTVTVYTAVLQNFIDALAPLFEAESGTSVEIIKAGSGELLNRLTAEAGNPQGDVLWSVDGTVIDFQSRPLRSLRRRHARGGHEPERNVDSLHRRRHGLHCQRG